jgi:NAD(P)-dependent dehydrogenase (short-subunit alcohol dehydrogenase family)
MNLSGATALVTGGSNGIGFAIAKTLTQTNPGGDVVDAETRAGSQCHRKRLGL